MSCNERTALLATWQQQQQRQQREEQLGQLEQKEEEKNEGAHVIVVPAGKDGKDYAPVFTTAEYSYGLSLAELLPYGRDPWWQRLRRLCFACLWLTFTLTLLASLGLAYYHDDKALACRAPTLQLVTTTSTPPLALAANGSLLTLLAG